jgi:hypothetical protein
MSCGHGTHAEGCLNDWKTGQLILISPRFRMEIEKDTVDSSSGQVYANGNLHNSPFDYTSQGSSRPYSDDRATSLYAQRDPRLKVHPQN